MPDNLPNLWRTIGERLKYTDCRGVSLQPMFTSVHTLVRPDGTPDSFCRHHPIFPDTK